MEEAMERMEREKEEAIVGVAKCFGVVFGKLKELEVEQVGRRKEDGTDVSIFWVLILIVI